MRVVGRLAFCLTLVCAFGSVDAGVNVDYDTEADFSGFKTYAWKTGTEAENPLMHKRIVRVIEKQLESVGLEKVDSDPDVYVLYHVALGQEQRVNVDDFGYWRRWRAPVGYSVDVYDVNIGTLILDMLDAGSGEGVWRGRAEKDLPSNPDPEKVEKKLGKIMMKMFRKFPPE
jgi:hypothetical protein